jgi:hypothetical protein
MTERPEGLDDLLDFVANRIDPVQAARDLRKVLSHEEWQMLSYGSDLIECLLDRIDRYEKNLPSWSNGTPEDVDAWLRDLIPDDQRLTFYRWIGTAAVREAVSDAKEQIGNDPVPAEHRYYSPDNVEELLDLMAPDDGDIGYPSVLPIGRPFCDVSHHTHTHGGSRLPTCHLDSEEK